MLPRHKFPLLLLLIAFALSSFARADGLGPTPYPASERDWPGVGVVRVFPWMVQNREHFWTKRAQKQGAIVFIGDSLVGNWRTLEGAFPGMKIANRGIGGDVSRGVLFRFQEDVLDLQPTGVVILVGTNDLSAHGATVDVASNLAAVIAMAKKYNPAMPVVVCTVPPRANPKAPIRPGSLAELNVHIRSLASEHVKVLDLFTLFSTPAGEPEPEYFKPDLLHLDARGYEKFRDAIQPLLSAF